MQQYEEDMGLEDVGTDIFLHHVGFDDEEDLFAEAEEDLFA